MTAARKEINRVGMEISKQLEPVMDRVQVGKALNLSESAVRNIEYQALYKIAMRLRAMRKDGDL